MSHDHGEPDRISRSPSLTRRVTSSSSAIVRSAVASTSTPGAFVATAPRAVIAATSEVVVAGGRVRHHAQPRPGRVEDVRSDPVVERRDHRVGAGHRGARLGRRQRPVVGETVTEPIPVSGASTSPGRARVMKMRTGPPSAGRVSRRAAPPA
ncbi:hypothetical protein LUW76_24385 [Actinomadura madurae]|nr:hypothetical protein [Actinomadura madurae]URM97239.1 hypothetical protein LUW76_24385 [Actinomadura madurae]